MVTLERPRDNKRVVHATASIPAGVHNPWPRDSDSGRVPDDQRVEVAGGRRNRRRSNSARDGPGRRGCLAARGGWSWRRHGRECSLLL
jgi:hypothetical protein